MKKIKVTIKYVIFQTKCIGHINKCNELNSLIKRKFFPVWLKSKINYFLHKTDAVNKVISKVESKVMH